MIIKGTSCYQNVKSGNLVSITGDGGNGWGYYGNAYKKLAPSLKLWQYYDSNPYNLKEVDLIDYYIREFYELRLRNLNPYDLLDTLNYKFGEEIILLCHEIPGVELNKEHFCHRRLLADWLELETGIIIPELSIAENGDVIKKETYNLKPKIKQLIKKY